jgi:hypothetical protein
MKQSPSYEASSPHILNKFREFYEIDKVVSDIKTVRLL